jgi:hypothetical protein
MRAVLASLCTLCAMSSTAAEPARVLFVGNSLTASHNLPGMVAVLSTAAGAPLRVAAVTVPGASLGDHLDAGTAARRLAGERWDVVVLQQGPSSRPESGAQLRRDAARMAKLVRAAGARPALFMVWPVREEPEWFDGVRTSYESAARHVDGLFLPAGEAWRLVGRRVELYDPDGLHPTRAGSYLAALVITAALTGRSPRGLPAPDGMAKETAAVLQQAAEDSLRR